MVFVGWLGRGNTHLLHCTHHVLTRMLKSEQAPAHLLFFLSFLCSFADMGSALKQFLRANMVQPRADVADLSCYNLASKSRSSQPCTQRCHDFLETVTGHWAIL